MAGGDCQRTNEQNASGPSEATQVICIQVCYVVSLTNILFIGTGWFGGRQGR